MPIGEEFELKISENPSTPFRFRVADADMKYSGVSDVVEYLGEEFESHDNPHGYVGVGGHKYMKFKVIGSGDAWLHLLNGRIWEVQESIDAGEDLDKYIEKMIRVVGLEDEDM